MHLKTRNVNTAFRGLLSGIHNGIVPTEVGPSRNGEVLVVEEPVIVSYSAPWERVLLAPNRDANPFFHLYEALWMLAGRNDVEPLVYYNRRMANYSDDGKTFNGAYGHRWRNMPWYGGTTLDQLTQLIRHLKADPWSRRAVLQMWNVEDDLLKIHCSKDVCCNTHAYFLVEKGRCSWCKGTGKEPVFNDAVEQTGYSDGPCVKCYGKPHELPSYLNMTVCNRSNDLIWGLLGANAVHFSILQEYLAARLGLEVGAYNQITNNLHVYTNNWNPELWLTGLLDDYPKETVPLVKDPVSFDRELPAFVERHSKDAFAGEYTEPFLRDVAQPLCLAYHHHRNKQTDQAIRIVDDGVADAAWSAAALEWLTRRLKDRV